MRSQSYIASFLLRSVVVLGASALVACSVKTTDSDGNIPGTNIDPDDIDDMIDDAANNIEICDGMTFNELQHSNGLSDGCRDLINSYLPQPEDNFSGQLIVLGNYIDSDGSVVIALHGADAQGNAIDQSAFAEATVSVDGTILSAQAAQPTPIGDAGADAGASLSAEAGVSLEGQFSFTFSADITGELLSLQFVNDYSASMRDDDLDIVSTIHSDILDVLPQAIYEGEATYFSTEVTVKLPFTDDESALRSALERDTSIDRDTTALYDGMGTGLSSLLTRDRPLKLLIVSTDGLENSSTEFSKADIVSRLQQNHVAVLMLGAVFSNVDEMQDLAGPYGVFFYTPAYDDLRAAVQQYVESLSNLALLRLPPEYADADQVQISVAGEQVSVDPSP